MADVFGVIGNQRVELNNAATEATMRELLLAIQGMGSGSSAAKTAQVATVAGINNANTQLQNLSVTTSKTQQAGEKLGRGFAYTQIAAESLTSSFNKVDDAIGPFVSKLISGTATVSDFYGTLSKLPGVLGAVAGIFQKVASFQETNLASYQQLTKAGVNFGGSLTQLREAALSTYMSLDQFTNLMKTNSTTFAKMGGSADFGARAFVKMSNDLNASNAGRELRALGLTSEEVNQGLADYIALTGGRTRQELQNTRDITKGASEYLEQLDGLAKLTGESREELAKKMKEDAANQAFDSYLLTLDEEGRKKAIMARTEAEARGGKGAAQALQAKLMGLPPMTEAAQKFVGTMKNGNQALDGLASSVKDNSKTVDDVRKSGANFTAGLAQDGRNLKQVGTAMIMANKDVELYGKAVGAANQATRNGITTAEQQRAFEAKQAEDAKKQKKSEADAAAEAQKSIQQMGQSIMAMLMPAIQLLTPLVNALVSSFGWLIGKLAEFKNVTIGLVAALVSYAATQKVLEAMARVKAAREAGAGGAGVLGSIFQSKGQLGSSALNPLYVMVIGSLPGGRGSLPGGPSGQGRTSGQTGATGVGGPSDLRQQRLDRVQQGRAMQTAGTGLKVAGVVGSLAAAASMISELRNIDKKAEERAKEVGKEKADAEASKEKGGVIGETAGGMAGGLAGAKAGAVIGAIGGPLGVAIGGAIGGIAGGLLGAWGGKSAGEAMAGSKSIPKMAEGGVVTQPTTVLAGEAGPEAIIPLKHFESLQIELQMLNKQTAEMIRYMRDTAEYTKRTVDATKSLNGDLFKF